MAEDLSYILDKLKMAPFNMKELSLSSLRREIHLLMAHECTVHACVAWRIRLLSQCRVLKTKQCWAESLPPCASRSEKAGDSLLQLLGDVVGKVSPNTVRSQCVLKDKKHRPSTLQELIPCNAAPAGP